MINWKNRNKLRNKQVKRMSARSNNQGKSALLKVILLGDGGVGKSSLMNRYVCDTFDDKCFHTIGVEFLNKEVEIKGNPYTLQVGDEIVLLRTRVHVAVYYSDL